MSKTKHPVGRSRRPGDGHGDPVVIAASVPGRSGPASPGSLEFRSAQDWKSGARVSGDRRESELPTLRAGWADLFRRPPRKGISRRLPLYALAYNTQARAHGGLRPATRHKLLQADREEPSTGATTRRRERRGALSPGSRLVREWQGRSYTVEVTDRGFLYGGRQYRSLSEVARTITGARWSGPRFFGL